MVATVATPAYVQAVQVIGDVESRRSTSGRAACEEEEVEGVEVGPRVRGQKPATVAETVAVAPPDQMRNDKMTKVEEMKENLKTENLSLHGELAAKRTAQGCPLLACIRLQRDRKSAIEEKEGAARPLAAEKTKRESSAVIEQLKRDV